jgi:hypothetical protein
MPVMIGHNTKEEGATGYDSGNQSFVSAISRKEDYQVVQAPRRKVIPNFKELANQYQSNSSYGTGAS